MKSCFATLTRDREGRPLVELDGGPFNGTEFRPADLRELAGQLIQVANEAERMPVAGKHWTPQRVQIGGPEQAPQGNL